MITLLPAIVTYLQATLVSVTPQIAQLVVARPDGWVRENMSALKFPAVFVWSVSSDFDGGVAGDTADEELRVKIMVLFQSIKPDVAAFDATKSPFALYKTIRQLLSQNKKLIMDGSKPVVTGLELPISEQDFEIFQPIQGGGLSTFGTGRNIYLTYRREGHPWSWLQNNENPAITPDPWQ